MRATVIAELGNRLSSSSGRRKEAVWLFTALVLTAAIPVLLLGGWMAYITADQERSYARKAATEALTQVAHRIEGELCRELQVAETLASSAALDQGNLGDFYRENPPFILSDYLVLDVIIGHAVRLAWLQDHPGDDAYEDQKALAWQRFYDEPPESVAHWIVAALRYLAEQENPAASSQVVSA